MFWVLNRMISIEHQKAIHFHYEIKKDIMSKNTLLSGCLAQRGFHTLVIPEAYHAHTKM